jgi:hypothetical protein
VFLDPPVILIGTFALGLRLFTASNEEWRRSMKYAVALAAAATLLAAVPASAEDVGVGVGVGPNGAGVTVGASPDRYREERDRTTVIKEREPRDKTTIIKKERDPEPDRKVIINQDR